MPIAIPDVSSHAIGPRDMGMLTGHILHGSSEKSGQRTFSFVAHILMRYSMSDTLAAAPTSGGSGGRTSSCCRSRG